MTLRNLGFANGFIPQATGQVIAFMRKADKFRLAQYVQYVPAQAPQGAYAKLGRDAFVRSVSRARRAWEDGSRRPRQQYNNVPFEWVSFRTNRRDYGWEIGYKAIEYTTAFSPKLAHMAMAVSQCMTDRTLDVIELLQTASNWPSTHVDDANDLNEGAGYWDLASSDPDSPGYMAIYKSLVNAAQIINQDTNNAVEPDALVTIVSPVAARKMSASREIVEYTKSSPAAKEILEKGLDPQYNLWGLPSMYRGFKFVVENAVYVSSEADADGDEATVGVDRTWIKNDSSAIMVSRPGGIDGEAGAPSFSTVQIYHLGGLAQVEAFDEPRDRLIEGHVSEDIFCALAAGVSGFKIDNIMSS